MRIDSIGGLALATFSILTHGHQISFEIFLELKKGNRMLGPLILTQECISMIFHDLIMDNNPNCHQ
jgi:hypothetical protein